MAKHVIIHLPEIGQNYVQWAVADDRGGLISEVQSGTFEEAAQQVEGSRATLVFPGDNVLLSEATVPGGSAARALQAVPFALEDQLADDVDSLHFALGSKSKEDIYPVAVVSREHMDLIKEQCAASGLRPSAMVPEPQTLPKFDATELDSISWTALVDEGRTVVRLNGLNGFSTDVAMAPIMLEGAINDLPEGISATMAVFKTDPYESFPVPPNVEVDERSCDSRLSLYASGLASTPHINLLQGEYSPKKQFDKTWKPWRWTAALLAILGVTVVVGKALEYRQTTQQIAQVDQQIETAFQEALPGSRMVRPVNQIKTRISALSGGSTDGFINSLSQIVASLATQPQTVVRSISYRNGRFDLDVTTDAIPTLDLLKSELKNRGDLTLTPQSVNKEKDGLRGRLRIE